MYKMNPKFIYITNLITYVFVVGVTIYALLTPYMTISANNITIDSYVSKDCVNDTCQSSNNGTALYVLYMIFMMLAMMMFIICLFKFNNKNAIMVKYLMGLGILGIAFGTMLTLIILVKTANMNFTSASILVIIACCFVIIKQFLSNRLLHSIPSKLFRMK